MKKGWLVIVNPNAGVGKADKHWPLISNLLDRSGVSYTPVFTKERGHAIDLAANNIKEGFKKIIVVGGDGTLNEVLNGIFAQQYVPTTEIAVAMIAVGTGNDWSRMFQISNDYDEAIQTIKNEMVIFQDVGKVIYHSDERKRSRYFMNIAGMGFDAMVLKKSNDQKDKGRAGKLIYFATLLSCLFNYKHIYSSITVDGYRIKDDIFSMNVGICKYSGGGMMQVPNAIADDGLFDMTVIRKMGKMEVIRNINRLYNGTLIDHPKVDAFRGKHIEIESENILKIEVDGESLGHAPFEFEIFPRSIGIVVGNEAYYQSKIEPVLNEKIA